MGIIKNLLFHYNSLYSLRFGVEGMNSFVVCLPFLLFAATCVNVIFRSKLGLRTKSMATFITKIANAINSNLKRTAIVHCLIGGLRSML